MELNHLKSLFENLKVNEKKDSENWVNLTNDQTIISIPKANLTERELALINLLEHKENVMPCKLTSWQKYLYQHDQQPKVSSTLRFLYFKVTNLSENYQKEWQQLISSFFKDGTSAFWDDANHMVLVDEECELNKSELAGMLSSVDNDFDCTTRVLVGFVWSKDDDLPAIFEEENKILRDRKNLPVVSTIPELALRYYLQNTNKNSAILNSLRNFFESSSNYTELIQALYQVGGNVTQASKNMFIHRNTLEYRLDKLMNERKLNLRTINDLIFCYLAIV